MIRRRQYIHIARHLYVYINNHRILPGMRCIMIKFESVPIQKKRDASKYSVVHLIKLYI